MRLLLLVVLVEVLGLSSRSPQARRLPNRRTRRSRRVVLLRTGTVTTNGRSDTAVVVVVCAGGVSSRSRLAVDVLDLVGRGGVVRDELVAFASGGRAREGNGGTGGGGGAGGKVARKVRGEAVVLVEVALPDGHNDGVYKRDNACQHPSRGGKLWRKSAKNDEKRRSRGERERTVVVDHILGNLRLALVDTKTLVRDGGVGRRGLSVEASEESPVGFGGSVRLCEETSVSTEYEGRWRKGGGRCA
jgi:hypothetical protein